MQDGALIVAGNAYHVLVFGPEQTVRRSVVEKALALVRSGGTVLFYGNLPTASTEGGRGDAELDSLLQHMLGTAAGTVPEDDVSTQFDGGGFCGFVHDAPAKLPQLIGQTIERDFLSTEEDLYVTHRRVGATDVYMVQNALDGLRSEMCARFRVDGVPELWDPFTGEVLPVDGFERRDGYTWVEQRLEGNTAMCFVFRPGDAQSKANLVKQTQTEMIPLANNWAFSVIPTRNNQWGEFRWPPSDESIGPEVRTFRYHEGDTANDWQRADLDDNHWPVTLYSTGPYWLMVTPDADDDNIVTSVLSDPTGQSWQEVRFSKSIAAAQAAPWGGHSGYPDGHIDKNFVHLPEGRKLLFTHIRSDQARRYGLRVELRNSTPRLWVNGVQQPFEDAVGNLPLEAGVNKVLLDLPDGGHGRLYVQAAPPNVATMAEAAAGTVKPQIDKAQWIWSGDTLACNTRQSIHTRRASDPGPRRG